MNVPDSALVLAQMQDGGGAGGSIIFLLIWLLVVVVVIAGLWKTFVKAGKPGIVSIIPIVNMVFLLEIAGRPIWWIILFFIPLVNLIILIVVSIDVARKFGKGPAFGLGLAFLGMIFYPILGFGDAEYSPNA